MPGEAYERAVAQCLSRTDDLTRRTAWLLAVLGERATHAGPAELLGVSRQAGERSLRALHDMGLLAHGRFRHEAGRTAVLRRAEPPRSARLEARVAQVLYEHGAPATALARHLVAAETVDAPWALPVLLEAAEAALARDEVGTALDCLRVARDSCADERQLLEVRLALVRAGWRVDPSAAVRHLSALTDAAQAGRLTVRAMKALVGHLLWFGRADDALEVLRIVEQEQEQEQEGEGVARGRRWIRCGSGSRTGIRGWRGSTAPRWPRARIAVRRQVAGPPTCRPSRRPSSARWP
ncbi:hypothetical protein [Streptomyces sp. Ac-502]|uniref:hypothetical protein n=1 Tax=Streptomyces sp. Ac-502 TaxID=3342801 RepID=UPI003862727F